MENSLKKLITLYAALFLLIACSNSSDPQIEIQNDSKDIYEGFFDEALWLKAIKENQDSPEMQKLSDEERLEVKNSFKVPKASLGKWVSTQCHPKTFKDELMNAKNFGRKLKSLFEKCEKELSKGNSTDIIAMIKIALLRYKAAEREDINPFTYTHSDGTKINGFLALKKDGQKRPLVVVKCGIFCSGKGFSGSGKLSLMHLFDEGPFNVLLIGNGTGDDYIKDNKKIDVGGINESKYVYQLAQWIKNESEFKDQVEELHFVGISLGGHVALYTSVLNNYNPIFNSVVSYCPAVNLKEAVHNLYRSENKLRRFVFNLLTKSTTKSALQFILGLSDLVDSEGKPYKGSDFFDVIENLGFSQALSNLEDGHQFPYAGVPLKEKEDFWNINRGAIEAPTHITQKTPTLVWSSKDDWVIKYKDNSKFLEEAEKDFTVLSSPKGGHCAQSESYEWPVVGSILRSFLLRHTPSLKNKFKTHSFKYLAEKVKPLARFKHSHQVWTSEDGVKDLKLSYYYNGKCGTGRPGSRQKPCMRNTTINVDRESLDFSHLIPVATSIETAQAQTRWLNTHVYLKDANDEYLKDTSTAQTIIWDTTEN